MTHASLAIIRREHRALSAMLRSINLMLAEHRRHDTLPDFGALRAMLYYVDEFPERLHHPKESRLLFPKLRGHSEHMDTVLDRLDSDHASGEKAIRELEHALTGFEMMGKTEHPQTRREHYERSMQRYVDFYLAHMHVEETEVLPLAELLLSTNDWDELDAAFLTHHDPLAEFGTGDVYQPLFRQILSALPRSSGVGPALEALAGVASPKFPRSN